VTKDLQKESKEVNNGKAPRNSKPPLEIVYYKSEENEENAQRIRDILSKYKRDKKEQLISIFEKQFFAS
jgi:predicted GIY-YIG superfamily endonuclease